MFLGNVVPQEKIHPRLWKGSNRRFRPKPYGPTEVEKQNKVRILCTYCTRLRTRKTFLDTKQYKIRI